MDAKVLESEYPLLQMFRDKAPGSFKHCQKTAEICEAICREIPSLKEETLAIAATYHDIGKVFNPQFFTENMNGSGNVHDDLTPNVSFQFISRHLSDSVFILSTNGFSQEIIEIVSSHHGTNPVLFFFNKAKKENPLVDKDEFSYKGLVPQTDEAAVLMIVDSVEATARSLALNNKLGTEEDKVGVVEDAITKLDKWSQIDRLTLGTIKTVKRVLISELVSEYHARVDYDEED